MSARAMGLARKAAIDVLRLYGPAIARSPYFHQLIYNQVRTNGAGGAGATARDLALELGCTDELGDFWSHLVDTVTSAITTVAHWTIGIPGRIGSDLVYSTTGHILREMDADHAAQIIDRMRHSTEVATQWGVNAAPAVVEGAITGNVWGAVIAGVSSIVGQALQRRQMIDERRAYQQLADQVTAMDAEQRRGLIALVAADLAARQYASAAPATAAALVQHYAELLDAKTSDGATLAEASADIIADEEIAAGRTSASHDDLAQYLADQLHNGKIAADLVIPRTQAELQPGVIDDKVGTVTPKAGSTLPSWTLPAAGAVVLLWILRRHHAAT